jgi:glycosyltransferase involved in cell wall biosynthesis
MRIAHVSDCYLPRLGGIELQVRDLAERQAGAGHDVTLFTSTVGPPRSGNETGEVAVDRVRALGRRFPMTRGAGDIAYRDSWKARDKVASGKFDAVHVHTSTFSPLAFLVARDAGRRGVPTVVTLHSMWSKAEPLFHGADWVAGWAGWEVTWTAVSEAAAQPLRRVMRGRQPVYILPNSIDPEEWQVPRRPRSPETFRVAAVMRLSPRKRPLQLLRILERARGLTDPSVEIRAEIMGEGPERKAMQRYLRRHGMAGWVNLAGRVSRPAIRSVYESADLFVAPATFESFGIAALEARASGVPVLARNGTGVTEFLVDGRDGFLVDSDSAMAEAVAGMAAGSDPRWSLGSAPGHRLGPVPEKVTWSASLPRCEMLYAAAARQHGLPSVAGLGGGDPEILVTTRLPAQVGDPG